MEMPEFRKVPLLCKMSILLVAGGIGCIAGLAEAGDKFSGKHPGTPPGIPPMLNDNELRTQAVQPSEELLALVAEYRKLDPEASFTFFNGHVDSFSTAPKSEVPEYAVRILKKLGLSARAVEPMKIQMPVFSGDQEKLGHDVEATPDAKLPYVTEDVEPPRKLARKEKDKEDASESSLGEPDEENRTEPAIAPHEMLAWDRPGKDQLEKEKRAATQVLQAFLAQREKLFEVSAEGLEGSLELLDYKHGAYAKAAVYKQFYSKGESVLYGKTVVQFDVNWNVVGISRMLVTPEKLSLPKSAAEISKKKAIGIAEQAMEGCVSNDAKALEAEPSIDLIRRMKVWNIELTSKKGECHWSVVLDRVDGKVLNVSDLVNRAYNDAQVNRWYFSGGDLTAPQQIVSPNQYTRNDRRLEHDFFYVMNDHRCEGSAETNCAATAHADTWCEFAYGTEDGASYIRATRRINRDFDSYFPSGESETFGETNTYYWSRWFSQWLKPSLDALGVLPSSASDYPRVLIVSDACLDRSVHDSTFPVTTDDNKGEGGNVIRLAHNDPAGSADRNSSCEGGGCFDNPSNVQHELNHFYLSRYHDVGSGLDCGSGMQLRYTHEGILGTVVPHAFWHDYYSVGYAPTDTNRLYFSDTDIGRVHTDDTDLSKLTDFYCVDNTDYDNSYRSGRVVGQALWKFYHGKKVDGATITNTWHPSTDTDFNTLVYWAAELQSGSTYQDRYEFANRVMEILDKYSNWSSAGKSDYCDIFEVHELANYINPDYCN